MLLIRGTFMLNVLSDETFVSKLWHKHYDHNVYVFSRKQLLKWPLHKYGYAAHNNVDQSFMQKDH